MHLRINDACEENRGVKTKVTGNQKEENKCVNSKPIFADMKKKDAMKHAQGIWENTRRGCMGRDSQYSLSDQAFSQITRSASCFTPSLKLFLLIPTHLSPAFRTTNDVMYKDEPAEGSGCILTSCL